VVFPDESSSRLTVKPSADVSPRTGSSPRLAPSAVVVVAFFCERGTHALVCRGWIGLLILSVVATQRAAHGSPSTGDATMRVSWVRDEGATDCPGVRVVEERTRSWLGRDPFLPTATTTAEILVTGREGSFAARIRIRGENGVVVGERLIASEDRSCDTLVSAVALALAIQIDPDAAFGPKRTPSPASPPAASPPPPDSTSKESRSAPSLPREASLSAGSFLSSGLVPGFAFGARVVGSLAWLPRWHVLVSGTFVPERTTSDGRFAFGLAFAGVGGCFSALEGTVARLAPCVEVHAGEIHALVYTLEPTPPGGRFWAGASAIVRAQLRVLRPLLVEVGAGVMVPVTRTRFAVTGHPETVFQEPIVAPTADVSVGLTFP